MKFYPGQIVSLKQTYALYAMIDDENCCKYSMIKAPSHVRQAFEPTALVISGVVQARAADSRLIFSFVHVIVNGVPSHLWTGDIIGFLIP